MTAANVARATWEMLPEALDAIRKCGGFVRLMEAETMGYRIDFAHPSFSGREMAVCFTRVIEKGYFTACLKDLGPLASAIPSQRADDAEGGSAGTEGSAAANGCDAQTPIPSSRERK